MTGPDGESPVKTKQELFAENPDQFENVDDLLVSYKLIDNKPRIMINFRRMEQAYEAFFKIPKHIDGWILYQMAEAHKKNKSNIVTPGQGQNGRNNFRSNMDKRMGPK